MNNNRCSTVGHTTDSLFTGKTLLQKRLVGGLGLKPAGEGCFGDGSFHGGNAVFQVRVDPKDATIAETSVGYLANYLLRFAACSSPPPGGEEQGAENFQEGCFSGPVCPQQSQDLALSDLETHPIKGCCPAVVKGSADHLPPAPPYGVGFE